MPPATSPRSGRPARAIEAAARRLTTLLDAAMHRLYGWRWNPLHQSGALAVWLLVVLTATGLYLLLFYRVGAPAESVARMADDPWLGRWIRTLHRYATDAFVLAAVLHATRLVGQARAWGPRTRAWATGVLLVGVGLACAWTGFVMAWDAFGVRLAVGGARLFDALPVLSEPVRRIFLGAAAPPPAFFFINLFVHIALPLAMGILLWLHVSRVARPVLAPPRDLRWRITAALLALAVLLPAPLGDSGRPLRLPDRTPIDLFTAWWLPLSERTNPGVVWALAGLVTAAAFAVPLLVRRSRAGAWAPSVVDARLCTECDQCTKDCPWEAITMVPRTDARPTLVALVDPERCVSCGICAGSCAPMGVGPPGRTGRDQLAGLDLLPWAASEVDARLVVLGCERAPAAGHASLAAAGARVELVPCVGAVHSSVVERFLRRGARGVMLTGCPPRDCAGREGPAWLEQRTFHGREADLKPRVDRRRVLLATLAIGAEHETVAAFEAFRDALQGLETPPVESVLEPDPACESTTATTGG